MKTKILTLREILIRMQQHIVPCYHRDYLWGKQQWDDVWIPIIELSQREKPSSYFLGIMLTQPEPLPQNVDKIILHDGYQRLMTVFILLALLRDMEKSNGRADDAEIIHDVYLINRYTNSEETMKLVPAEDDQESFNQLIMGGSRVNGSRIFDAYDHFQSRLATSSLSLEVVLRCILDFRLVNIVLEKGNDAHQIWKTLVTV